MRIRLFLPIPRTYAPAPAYAHTYARIRTHARIIFLLFDISIYTYNNYIYFYCIVNIIISKTSKVFKEYLNDPLDRVF